MVKHMNALVARHSYPLLVLLVFVGCNDRSEGNPAWQYPVNFGDDRHKVYAVLGPPHDKGSWRETFPSSGVAVWFVEDKVSKFTFIGDASNIPVRRPTSGPRQR